MLGWMRCFYNSGGGIGWQGGEWVMQQILGQEGREKEQQQEEVAVARVSQSLQG